MSPDSTISDRLAVPVLEARPALNHYQRAILYALNRTGKHVYAGTVPAATIANRRAKSKAARLARRKSR